MVSVSVGEGLKVRPQFGFTTPGHAYVDKDKELPVTVTGGKPGQRVRLAVLFEYGGTVEGDAITITGADVMDSHGTVTLMAKLNVLSSKMGERRCFIRAEVDEGGSASSEPFEAVTKLCRIKDLLQCS